MVEKWFPFDSGSGANVQELYWGKMAKNWLSTGVIPGWGNELGVFGDSTGMQVKVPSGRAWVEGFFYEQDGLLWPNITKAISTADATYPRIDRVVLRLDTVANTISLVVLQGLPAASPTPPSLTQTSAQWDLPLAQITVDAAVATIAAAKVKDERQWAGPITTPFDAKTLRSYVHAYPTAGQGFTSGTWAKVNFPTEVSDNLGEYDTALSRFTAKRGGLYLIQAAISFVAIGAIQLRLMAYKNGTASVYLFDLPLPAGDINPVGHGTLLLNAGDYIEIYCQISGNATTAAGTGDGTQFLKVLQIA